MGYPAAEFDVGKADIRAWAQGVADQAGWLAGEAGQYLPLFGDGQAVETWMTTVGEVEDVLPQVLKQGVVAGQAKPQLCSRQQVLFQLPAGAGGGGQQRAQANPVMPGQEQCAEQQRQQGLWEVAP